MILKFYKTVFRIAFLFTLTFLINNCSSEDNPGYNSNLIIQSTEANIITTFTSIKVSGKILSDNGITSKGICWSKNPNPTIDNNKITENTSTFNTLVNDLNPNTIYYFRVFATTSSGTTYGQEKTFSTKSLGDTYWQFTIIDHNGTEILAKVNFYEDGTTKYEQENCPTCYVPIGTWTIDGINLLYIGENSDPAISTHVFYGTFSGVTLQGIYKNLSNPDGNWSAEIIP